MGLDANGVRFLLVAAENGVDFSRFVSIGRQGLHLELPALQRLLQRYGRDPAQAERLLTADGGFADSLYRMLGAKEVHSIDASRFEEASIVHDMNHPVPEDLKRRFTAVCDGGSLEHIFSFPTAIQNCMEMVAEHGHFLAITPANNFLGHGFYQFSPELFFRVLSEENGFLIELMLIFESRPDARWYEVPDPAQLGRRLELRNSRETYLLIQARRTRAIAPFAAMPQQSDYSVAWCAHPTGATASARATLRDRLRPWLPGSAKRAFRRWRNLFVAQSARRYHGFKAAGLRPFRESAR